MALKKRNLNIPPSTFSKAQKGLSMMKESILELAQINEGEITNSEASEALGLHSDYEGKQKDYLVYSILGLLIKDKVMAREKGNRTPPIKHTIIPG
jgi:hypothetical protein